MSGPGYVYRVWDDESLIYIGSSINWSVRLSQHRLYSWWAPTVARVKVNVYPSVEVAREVERAAIAAERPRWNRLKTGRGKWTEQQFRDYVQSWVSEEQHKMDYGWRDSAIHLLHPDGHLPRRLNHLKREFHQRFGGEIDLEFIDPGTPFPERVAS